MRGLLLILIISASSFAQETTLEKPTKNWYEKINLKGYAQFRYNRLGESNRDFKCPSCDRSIGDKQGFFMRRARLVFYGDVSDRVYIYIQPDYATDAATDSQNYFQLRDAYFDYALVPNKEWRVRMGISKVPFGFDNLQSSSNRGPLDRGDAINTSAPNERDTGLYVMWSPDQIRQRLRELTKNDLKGSGDYGMFAVGVYNGQTLNKPEKNNDLHRVIRFTYPYKFSEGQYIEASLQAYEGKYTTVDGTDFYDQRSAASLIVYPQPFGLQAEFVTGRGPEFSAREGKVVGDELKGGHVQLMYQTEVHEQRYYPYLRYQEYEGGRKLNDGMLLRTREWEIGAEWQPNPALELTAAFAISDRLTQLSPTDRFHEKGNLIRLQSQFNY